MSRVSGFDLRPLFPDRWPRSRFGALFVESQERNGDTPIGLPLSVSEYRGVVPRDSSVGQVESEDVASYRVVRPNQLAVNVMWLNRSGLGVSQHTGYVSPAYKVFRISSDLHPSFANHLLRSTLYRAVFESIGRGVRPNAQMADTAELRAMHVPLPPLPEQRAIADYLDRETARIDTLIEEQQRLVEMLRERRVAVIARAVTMGLNPNVESQKTGVDWFKVAPSHWEIKRLKFSVASSQTGVWGSDPRGDESDILCVRVADFDRPRLRVSDEIPTIRSVSEKDRAPRLLEAGDLLLEKSGGTAINPVGFVGIFEGTTEPAVSANFLARLRPAPGQFARYWLYAHAASYATRLTARSVKQTTGIQNLDQNSYFDEMFPFPPFDEQCRIAEHLDGQTSKTDTLITETERFIELSRERRSALITAAVTGQIDVREEVA